ncbi:two-component system response regulator OmpR [Klebsiella pneumoniae]|nr:two-component system response regulator OmpR [Klebsiella pneumoniae]
MQENYKILVVDDDMRLRALLERYLTEQGFQVRSVANAEQMDRLLTRESFHLMVLDLMLPGEDGLSICRRLRSQSNPMPIIMVTAKGEEVDRIVGLEIGADDYIPKPFNPRELLARIRAVLRRQANELPGAPSQEEAVIAFGKFKLNLGTREMFREDEPMPLTSGEFAVLKALVSHPREPLSRDKLMNLARGREYSAMERSIDVQISPAPHGGRGPGASALTSRPSGVWATSSSRTVLRHETRALFAAQLLCSHTAPDRHLAVRQPGDDLSGGTEFRDPAESPAV